MIMRRQGTGLMARFEVTRRRGRKATAADGDALAGPDPAGSGAPENPASRLWQALLGPFSADPPPSSGQPGRPRPGAPGR